MRYIDQLVERYPLLGGCHEDIRKAAQALVSTFESGGKLLVAGNGGSCADSDHIVGELLKGFCKTRPVPQELADRMRGIDEEAAAYLSCRLQGALPAIALANNGALMTACLNDVDGNVIFAQQVHGYGRPEDVFLGISTSGNSKDVVYAAVVARARGLKTIALTGRDGGRLKGLSDISIVVPLDETYLIQELHLPIYHALCLEVEEHFWKE